jgi:hypothetical protein
VYDPVADVFHVNVLDPAVIAVVDAGQPATPLRLVGRTGLV